MTRLARSVLCLAASWTLLGSSSPAHASLPLANLGPVSSDVQVQDQRYILTRAPHQPPVVRDDATGTTYRVALDPLCVGEHLRFPLLVATCVGDQGRGSPVVANLRSGALTPFDPSVTDPPKPSWERVSYYDAGSAWLAGISPSAIPAHGGGGGGPGPSLWVYLNRITMQRVFASALAPRDLDDPRLRPLARPRSACRALTGRLTRRLTTSVPVLCAHKTGRVLALVLHRRDHRPRVLTR
jgi:hypothetical protein